MKHLIAAWLRRQANRLDPPAKPSPWIYGENYTSSSAGAKLTFKETR